MPFSFSGRSVLTIHRTGPKAARRLHPLNRLFCWLVSGLALSCGLGLAAANAKRPGGAADAAAHFRDEMQQVTERLKWRGERLTEDTIYAAALTGLTWQTAWGKDHLFSLAWGDLRRVPTMGRRNRQSYGTMAADIQRAHDSGDYGRAVSVAFSNFTLEEIGCDVNLKLPVGLSLMVQGQPERAFPILSAPFEAPRAADVTTLNRRFREAAFEAAQRAHLTKDSIAFALSLLLEPATEDSSVNIGMLRFLERSGVDVDRVLLGILQAPERLRGLPAYTYAAADLLVYRASTRTLPLLLHLAESDDVYLRSRALLGLSVLAYQTHPVGPSEWEKRIVLRSLREYGLSASERRFIDQEVQQAAESDKYRLRATAALALGILGGEEAIPLLQKLARDRAYLLSPPEKGSKTRRILFPVRIAAAAALARYGIRAETGGGDFAGRDLDKARRGGQDVSHDRRNLRRDALSRITVSPLDGVLAPPVEPLRR